MLNSGEMWAEHGREYLQERNDRGLWRIVMNRHEYLEGLFSMREMLPTESESDLWTRWDMLNRFVRVLSKLQHSGYNPFYGLEYFT